MKTTVYVDWNNQKILNEKEKAKWIEDKLEELLGDEEQFRYFLEWVTNIHDLYFMNENQKQKIWNDFSEEERAEAVLEFDKCFKKMEIEV